MKSELESQFQGRIREAKKGNIDETEQLLVAAESTLRAAIQGILNRQNPGRYATLITLEDVLQETLAKAFVEIYKCRANSARAFEGWLVRIAENNVKDAIRSAQAARRRPPTSLVGLDDGLSNLMLVMGTTPSTPTLQRERQSLLHAAIERLPPLYRTLIKRHYLDQVKPGDLLSELGVTRSAFSMRKANALACLRETIGTTSLFFSR